MKIHQVKGDGNCLFNSIAYGILFRESAPSKPSKSSVSQLARQLRFKMTAYMYASILNSKRNNNIIEAMSTSYNEEFSNYVHNDLYDTLNNKQAQILKSIKYIETMSQNGTWGGIIELKFLNEIVKKEYDFRGIVIYDVDTEKKFVGMDLPLSRNKKPILSIVHHTGLHYDYVEISSKLKRQKPKSSLPKRLH